MELIKTKIDKDILKNNKNLSKDMCFFDIETTGFNRNKDIIYLIGILYFDQRENSWIVSQYFANDLKDEPELLLEASKFLTNFKIIVNYNGNTFDIPFVNHKLEYFQIDYPIEKEKSLDIYSILRKNKSFLDIDNLKLKTVERYLGIYREDIYSGKDCIDFYKNYILNGNLELKERLLTHNFEDLYFLIDIMEILDIIREEKSFTVKKDDQLLSFSIDNIRESNDTMIFQGELQGNKDKIIHYDRNFDVIIEDLNRFEIIIYTSKALVTPNEVCTFIDKKDFNLSQTFTFSHDYELPEDIYLLKVDSNYLIKDIRVFLKALLEIIL